MEGEWACPCSNPKSSSVRSVRKIVPNIRFYRKMFLRLCFYVLCLCLRSCFYIKICFYRKLLSGESSIRQVNGLIPISIETSVDFHNFFPETFLWKCFSAFKHDKQMASSQCEIISFRWECVQSREWILRNNNNNNNKYIYNAHNYCQQHHRGAVGGQQLAVNK